MATLNLSLNNQPLGSYYIADNSDILVGRDSGCGIHINSPDIAPQHAWIFRNAGACRVLTLNSEYPVLLKGKKISDRGLADGDQLQIGEYSISLALSDQDTQPLPHEILQGVSHRDTRPQAPTSTDGYIQILNGSNLGRIVPLNHTLVRLGKPSSSCAMIARRREGYFLTHLQGPRTPYVDGTSIGERPHPLRSGNIIKIGNIHMAFHAGGI